MYPYTLRAVFDALFGVTVLTRAIHFIQWTETKQTIYLVVVVAWIILTTVVGKEFIVIHSSWSPLSDLNRRPAAYKAAALPTELKGHR